MFNISNYEYDCTRKCSSRAHGNQITAAITKRSISDEQIAAFIAKTCCNFSEVVDDLGRSAIHLAASVDRYALLEWLLNQGAILNRPDFESGSSALHRALYYGSIDCAVLLLRYGASLDLLDADTRCPLQMICRLDGLNFKYFIFPHNETLVWGSNKNYNLGMGMGEVDSLTPQTVDFFRKQNISINIVALGAYHSLFVDKKSQLYAVGHGKGGRLGIGSENSLPAPKKVRVPLKQGEAIIDVSASRKHSLLLTDRSTVFACGLNEDYQLGVRDAGEKLTVFKEVLTLRDFEVVGLKHVIARDHHSLTYSDKCIYIWGMNHGQFGLDNNVKTVPVPKLLSLPTKINQIKFVVANNGATVVYTKDCILVYYNYKLKTLKPPNFEVLKSISVVGGDTTASSKGTATALKLLMLTETDVIFLWYEMTQQIYRCIFSNIRISQIDRIFYKANQVLILSKGDVYKGKCNQVPLSSFVGNAETANLKGAAKQVASHIWSRCDQSNRIDISKEHMIRIDLQRVPNVDRVVDIFCDEDFASFAVLQESHLKYFRLPVLTPEEYTFKELYLRASDSNMHDIMFHVDGKTFPAHKFIVYSRSAGFREIISELLDENVYLNDDGLSTVMFELILKYIYMNYYPNLFDMEDIHHSLGPDSPGEHFEICQLFLGFAEKFKLTDLAKFLKSCLQLNPFFMPTLADKAIYRFARLRRQDFPALYDVRIVCADEAILSAHKCILIARMEYFEMMFTHSWAERSTIRLDTVPLEYMQPIVDFLYSSDVEHFRKQNYTLQYLYQMIIYCDQFFIERLRNICEIQVLDKITIRKCGEMLDFACCYNCSVLREGCVQFVSQNLSRVLSQNCLEQCEPAALKYINANYRKLHKNIFDYRVITPDADAVDDDLLLSFVEDFQVDLECGKNEDAINQSSNKLKSDDNKHNNKTGATKKYERAAISTMMEAISIDESTQSADKKTQRQSITLRETNEIVEKLHAEAANWHKVADKRIQSNKRPALSLKSNEPLKEADKPKEEYVLLKNNILDTNLKMKTTTPEKQMPIEPVYATPVKAYNLNLSDIAAGTSREKLSQKQRKRLASESSTSSSPAAASLSWRSPPAATSQKEPTTPVTIPNAWGVSPQAAATTTTAYSITPPVAATGSASDTSSFANMIRCSGNVGSAAASASSSNNSFAQIIAEERRQREYNERMRSKSLVLTQIEETAIAELRVFYNADNCTDEIVTIARKEMPVSAMNLPTWQHH